MKLIYILLPAIIFSGCNSNKSDNASHKHDVDSTAQSETIEHKGQLVLNDGKKWKLDEPTRLHISAIKQIVQSAKGDKNADYNQLVNKLQTEADKLISDCKMTGKDHDMLHLWLEEFLSSLRQLKLSKPSDQPGSFEKLNAIVNDFDNYFE